MTKRICSVEGCGRKYSAKGFCDMHYERVKNGVKNMCPERLVQPRGSGTINKQGYHQIVIKGKIKLAHRLTMEKILGRELLSDENVHHRNGNKLDNRPENLELWSRSQPSGQRVADKVAWAKEILKRYADYNMLTTSEDD